MDLHIGPLLGRVRCLVLISAALFCCSSAVAQIAGTNVNMVSGTQWPGGDPFLQRQNEPSIAVSSRNPFHLLAGANDYRSVDLALTTNGETGDAWLGLFKSLDGGATWRSILLPGCPYATTICSGAPAVKNAGYQAAADPTVRAGTNGMFYYSGLVFNRGFNPASAIIVSRLIDLNNKENADPNDILNGDSIQYVSTSVVATGTQSLFLDKPTMAVDVPRGGAATCKLSVSQPGNGVVNQSFAAGNVYVAYTGFHEAPNTDPENASGPQLSTLYFVRSTNCGATWSKPIAISGSIAINQGTSIAIDPNLGTIYIAWREFAYKTATVNQPDAIVVAASVDGGQHFTPPLRISTFTPFDEGTTNTSFRTNAYPTIAVDNSSRVYVAYAARNTVPSGDARIVLTNSVLGLLWSTPVPIDNPPVNPIANPSGRGHQIMPTLAFAGGRLSLLYYDLRLDHTYSAYTPLFNLGEPTGLYSQFPALAGELAENPPNINAVFNPFIDDSTITLRRHTFDLRMTEALPGKAPVFAPSVLVSQYAYGCCAPNQTDIEQLQFNVPNLPLFKSGTAPFMGDYVDLAPGPTILPPVPQGGQNAQGDDNNQGDEDGNSDDWHFNTSATTPTIYHATWTDNRDVQPPTDGDWTHYTPPNSPSLGTTSIFQPGTTPPACQPGFTGSRNQNIYTAPISGGLIFGAPSNNKTLGTTVFNGQTVPFQRAFVVVAQNTTQVVKSFRLTIANQPTGGSASFLQFSLLTTLDLSIPPLSSASRPVFVVSTNPTASVTVNIAEITAPQGTLVPSGLTGSTTLNPDATNPGITNPTETNPGITNPGITNFEVTDPGITNPGITNPTLTNPGITNPGITNPGITNSTFQNETVVNPGITNPGITNPGITNPTIADPGITNPGITNTNPANVSISDTQWTVVNNGNTTGAYTLNLASSSTVPQGNVLQLIISKLYQTPAAPTGTNCSLAVQTHYGIVTNIVNPAVLSPTDPGITNPGITNPGITNATVSLAPGETANIDVRVINTDFHTFPTFNPAASIVPVAVSQSVDTQVALASGGTGTVPPPPISVPPLIITTTSLPDGVAGAVYTALIGTQGGNPTAHTFAVTAGTLPAGLTINATTGAITGIPTAVGTSTFTVQVQDVGSTLFPQHTATQILTIRVAAPLAITTPPTLAAATQGAPYSQAVATTGGVGPFTFTLATGALPSGLTINGAGLIAGMPMGTGTSTFTIQVTDSSNPPQVTVQSFTVTVASATQIAAVVTFVKQPQNSMEGQPLANSPIQVSVTDSTGAAVANASVGMVLAGTPPCSTATLAGTIPQPTNASGIASFPDLVINRGQAGFSLLATAGNAVGTSNLFNVEGYCDTGSMSTGRHNHQVIALANGKLLVAGGDGNANFTGALASAELYDPATHTFSTVGSMHAARVDFTTTLLQNGQVLVTGGFSDTTVNASAELFDPSTNTFSLLPNSMTIPRSEHAATLLANGKVLITGGNNLAGVAVASAEIFDPATNTFTATSHPMNAIRQIHHADLVPNGRVLISGGFDVNNLPLASAELYDPVSDTFTLTGSMTTARGNHGSALLYNGKVLVAGGLANGPGGLVLSATAELYDPSTGAFAQTGSMSIPRATYTPIVLNDGTVFISAGAALPAGATADIYDPAAGTFRSTGSFTIQQAGVRDGILADGTALLMSGVNAAGAVIANAEIFYPIAPPASLTATTTAVGNAVQDQPYAQVLLEKGGTGNLLWTLASGALPPGVTLSTAGILSGSPTAAGTFTFTVRVTDSATPQKTATSATLTIVVSGVPLQFTSNTVPTAGFGRFYSQPLPIIGGTLPYTVTQTAGTLPPGLSLSGNGVLEGTPSGAGSFTFTVQATDSSAARQTATQTFTIAINTLFITTTVLPSGIAGVPYNAPISTSGGTVPLSFSLATAAFPPGLTIQQPAPGSNAGALAGTPTAAGEFTFSESVVDSSNPRQTATQNYVVTIAPAGTAVPAHVSFVTQPQNSIGGQTLSGGPVVVSVTDANNAPVPGATVALSFNGGPTCFDAVLSGTLQAVTGANGQASFSNLSIDRGMVGFNSLLATTGSASGQSASFAVQGFCASGNLSTPREGHTQNLLGTAQSVVKFPVDPMGAYTLTNTNPAPPGIPDVPHAPLIIPLAPLGIVQGTVISGISVGDMNFCSVGSFCFGEVFNPALCAVFSSSNTLLPSGGTINRVPGAIAPDFTMAFPCGTPPTLFGNIATDIPQDFFLFGEPVKVPFGAAYLFVEVDDSLYEDNSDPNRDFGVAITINTPSSVNGKVLIAGGFDNNGNALNTAELYDPPTGTTSPTGNLTDPNGRTNHASVVLSNGQVLLVGGVDNVVGALATAEFYDPTNGTFTATGSMSHARELPAAVVMADGRVLVSGGVNNNVATDTAEVYDPKTGLFTPTGNMNQGRTRHTMTLLPNGKVLVAGGRDAGANFFALASAEIFDPLANQGIGAFTAIGNMNSPRFKHTATLLSNGTVLVVGGFNGDNTSLSVTSAEIFDPSTNVFTPTGNMSIPRARQTSTLLPDGTVLEAGGINSFQGVTAPAPSEIYSPASGSFTQTGAMITGRELPQATQLFNGNVLVSGGDDGVNVLASTEIYYNTIAQAPIVITTTSLPNGFISQPYVQLLLEQNRSGPVTWSLVSGALPPGISLFGTVPPGLAAVGGASGVLSGTPTATGSFIFTLQATDGISTATSSFTINVSLATLAFTSNTMPSAGVGRTYSQPLPVTGGTLPYTASVTGGNLPPGLALSSNGILSGTPSTAGGFTFTVNVTDASAPAQVATQTLTIAVDTLFITTTALPDGIVGVPYNAPISTAGGTLPLTFSGATAAFPPGLTIQQPAATSQTGALSGTPTLAGHFTFTASVSDSSNPVQTATQTYTMDVFPVGSAAVPATVTFVRQPQNSVGGQTLSGSPIQVQVRDANGALVGGASVAISFNGAPPCASAVLSGRLTGVTGAGGSVFFSDLSIDRGQLGYTLLASAGSASAVSQPFTVNGFCETNAAMNTPRVVHSASSLLNGAVLIAGGWNNSAVPLASAELYNPSTGFFSPASSMTVPRWGHTATVLRDGRILIAGGVNSPSATVGSVTNTAEIYDPVAGTFTRTAGAMSVARYFHTATLLVDGRVLIAGGGTVIQANCFCSAPSITATAEIFDPATGLFTPTSNNLVMARHIATATLLTNGQVLIAGGADVLGLPLASVELYDPALSRFVATGALSVSRVFHAASLLPNGKVLIAGGETISFTGNTGVPAILRSAEIYDGATGTFAPASNLTAPRAFFSSAQLADGSLLLPGGEVSAGTPTNSAEIYNPAGGTFSLTGGLSSAGVLTASVQLQDGTILTTGGVTLSAVATVVNDAEVYYSAGSGNAIFVSNRTGNAINVLDGATGSVITTIPNVPTPQLMAFNPSDSALYVTTFESNGPLYDVNPQNDTVASTIVVGTDDHGVVVSPDGSRIYVANVGGSVSVINAFTNQVTATVSIAGQPAGIAITPNGQFVYVTDDSMKSVHVIDTSSNTVVKTISVGVFPVGIAVSPDDNSVYVTNYDSTVSVIATSSNTVLNTIPVGPGDWAVAFTPDGSKAYVTSETSNNVWVINTASQTATSIPVGTPTSGLAVYPGGRYVFAGSKTGQLIRIDTVTGAAITFASNLGEAVAVAIPVMSPLRMVIAANSLAPAILSKPYTQILLEEGGVGTLTWTLASGSLPPGVTLRNDGVLMGTPTATGTFTFAVRLVDSSTPQKNVISGNFILTVTSALTVPAQTFNTGIVGTPYGGAIAASGGTPPYSFAVTSGATPAGITLLSNGQFTGTPTTPGTSSFTVTVTDSAVPAQTASQTFSIQVVNPLAISTAALPGGTVGVAYSATVSSTGGVAPVNFVVGAGTFPPGLSLASTGAITGTPTSAGPFTFTVSATDSSTPAQTALQSYTVTIAPTIGAPANFTFATQPTTTTVGQPISPAVRVQVLDGNSNDVPGVTVTLGAAAGQNRPILSGTLSAVTDTSGIATFSNVVLDRAGTGLTLVASVSGVSSSGAVQQISPPESVQQGARESDTQIQMFSENRGVTLSASVAADITAPGTYASAAGLTSGSIASGTKVDSYYLHSDPVGISRMVTQLQAGGVTFPTDVLGVVVLDPQLTASDSALGLSFVLYPPAGRALALSSPTDTAILSADRRTVTLHLSGMSATKDVRVITAANPNAAFGSVSSAAFNAVAAPGSITTVAGSTWVFPGVGPATSVPLGLGADFIGAPMHTVADGSGNLYIADPNNNMIFKLSGGTLSIVAGTGVEGYSGDGGPASQARLDFPIGLALSSAGELYFSDSNNSVVRKVSTAGTIATVAGNGVSGDSGDGGPATSASLNSPEGINFDAAGNLLIADSSSGVIRKVDTAGRISTVPVATSPGLCDPEDVAVGPGSVLYVADSCGKIFKLDSGGNLTAVAGNGSIGYSGDGGPAVNAALDGPTAIAFDSAGDLFIADELNNVVRKVDATGTITTVMGQGAPGFAGDGGPGTLALLAQPGGLAFDPTGNLYITDTTNERIRKVDTSGAITTVAGNGRFKYAGDGGPATSASMNSPDGVAVAPAGNVFAAEIAGFVVRQVAPSGQISTYAGTGVTAPTYSGDGGEAIAASLNFPVDVQADSASNLYVTENGRVHKITPSGTITTLVNGRLTNSFTSPGSLPSDAHLALDGQGNVYIGGNSQVFKLDTAAAVTVFAGTAQGGFSGDGGPATVAKLSQIRGLAVDFAGNLYIADQGNRRVRKVDTTGVITTVAGNGTSAQSGDGGAATSAGVGGPFALAVDGGGNLYIGTGGIVRKVDATGTITTIVGGGFIGNSVDGIPATNAALTDVQGLAFDAAGNLYISDRFNDRIRKITGVTATPPFIFNVPSALTITTQGLPTGKQGVPYAETVSAVGGSSPYTWTVASGTLPPGLGLSAAGLISGTPTATGAFAFVVQVKDSVGAVATQSITITIN